MTIFLLWCHTGYFDSVSNPYSKELIDIFRDEKEAVFEMNRLQKIADRAQTSDSYEIEPWTI
jgi:hypothetical protein